MENLQAQLSNPYVIAGVVGAAVLMIFYILFSVVNTTLEGYERSYGDAVRGQLEGMFMFIPPQQLLTLKMSCATLGGILGFALFFGAGLFAATIIGLIAMIPFYFLPDKVLQFLYQKRLDHFNDQLVDGLITLSNGLRSGLNFQQAMDVLVQEMGPPISQEFNLVLQEIKLGVQTEKALESLAKRVPDEDLGILVTALNIARGVGGNLAEIFDKIAIVIRERKRIEGKVRAITAQGKLQAIVMASMPLVIALAMHFIDAHTLSYLYKTVPGVLIIIVVAVADYIGYRVIKSIITIDI